VVLGGGPIGCELAQSFASLGAQVTQVEMAPRIMIREDEEVSELAATPWQADGVQVLTGHKALRCEREGDVKGAWWCSTTARRSALSLTSCCAPWAAWPA
jgi:pyruvate/2-oxoglutarate dehydrogenase complex dihydrolipoamide dehydrogenase (E3) component